MQKIQTTTDMRWLRKSLGLSPLQAAEIFGTNSETVLEFEKRKSGYVVPEWRYKLMVWETVVQGFRAALRSEGHLALVLDDHAVLFRWDDDFQDYGPQDVVKRFPLPLCNVYNHSIVAVNFELERPWTLVEFAPALFNPWLKQNPDRTILEWAVEHAKTYREYTPREARLPPKRVYARPGA